MSISNLQTYEGLCSFLDSLPASRRDFPFGFDVLVHKLAGKIYSLMSWQADPIRLSLKSDPTEALRLRGLYSAITPGYHLNKRHWNTLLCDGSVPDDIVQGLILQSYNLVKSGLPRGVRTQLEMSTKEE